MNLRSAISHCSSLLKGDPQAWKHLPYQLRMKAQGIDLRWTSLEETGLSEERCYRYSDSGGPNLEELLDRLTISPLSDSVLDIGCGKGGALISFAKYPFARVDGVEISPALSRIAQANMKKLGIRHANVFCCDAAIFTELDAYSFFYLYNPFPRDVTAAVLHNMEASLRRRLRQVTLIYKNPVFHELVLGAGFRKVSETSETHPDYPPFFVYTTGCSAPVSGERTSCE
jgi:SAM-dependent methyltransferase